MSMFSVVDEASGPFARRQVDLKGKDLVTEPYPGVTTIYEGIKRATDLYKKKDCMLYREYLGDYEVKGTKIPGRTFGKTFKMSYGEVGDKIQQFGAALRSLGMEPLPESADGLKFNEYEGPSAMAIYENTCPHWMMSAQGAFSQALVVTTIYATLGIDSVATAVNEGNVVSLVCNRLSLPEILEMKKKDMPTLKNIIITDDYVKNEQMTELPKQEGLTIMTMDEMFELGKTKLEEFPVTKPRPDAIAVVMYTSGSTGKPKGVLANHKCLTAACSGGLQRLSCLKAGSETYLAYLPSAHILELVNQTAMLMLGAKVCYADPKTLSARLCKPKGALEEYKPSIMSGVPKIWEVLAQGVKAKIAAMPEGKKKSMILGAIEARKKAQAQGYKDTWWPVSKMLLGKLKGAVGGQIKLGVSGGGPLNPDVQAYVQLAFGMQLIQGYGLTETSAASTIQDVSDTRAGVVGHPVCCCEIMLASVTDDKGGFDTCIKDKNSNPYKNDDTTDAKGAKVAGRGEVLIRGPSVTLGYYKAPDKTAESYDKDGWFHTGDVGQWTEDGSLQIVDRVKNLVKLKGGEYIALESMETVFSAPDFVDKIGGGICVYGDGEMDRPCAIVQVALPAIKKMAEANSIAFEKDEDLLTNKDMVALVLKALHKEADEAKFAGFWKPSKITLLADPWTPDNKCLTATNKLSRRDVATRHETELRAMGALIGK